VIEEFEEGENINYIKIQHFKSINQISEAALLNKLRLSNFKDSIFSITRSTAQSATEAAQSKSKRAKSPKRNKSSKKEKRSKKRGKSPKSKKRNGKAKAH
jgi:hypothetical protein